MQITVVRRADSSGTTFVFTNHLAAVSEEWKKGPGVGNTVNWPASDKIVATPKNDGVTATVKQTKGSIGYIEYSLRQAREGRQRAPPEPRGSVCRRRR